MKITKTKTFKTLVTPLWKNNPVLVQILGICSSLAVTAQMKTAAVMALSLTLVVGFSSLAVL